MNWQESLESLKIRKGAGLQVVGHSLSCCVVKMPDNQSTSRLMLLSVFSLEQQELHFVFGNKCPDLLFNSGR